jgi:catechol-2,3-dioxygenase
VADDEAMTAAPRLTLSHSTRAARNMDTMVDFYCNVLGFHVTNRGMVGENEEIAFISQDPDEHHQIVLVGGMENAPQFMLADHLAFRVDDLDAVRAIKARLEEHGIEGVAPVSHGNAWSVYFTDPEGNGIECFTDTPFHVAQPYLERLPIELSNDEILEHTRAELADKPEFQPIDQYRAAMETKLAAEGR